MTKSPGTAQPAATLVLARDSTAGPEVLMMRRADRSAILGGYYVFPGGALDPLDQAENWQAPCIDDATANRHLDLPQGGLAYYLAAVRECFEEAGLLLAYDDSGASITFKTLERAAEFEALRRTLVAGRLDFAEFCDARRLRPALDRLIYIGHWISPIAMLRRYDTRFFLAAAPEAQIASHGNGELDDLAWLRPAAALARYQAGEFQLIKPTICTLQELADHRSVAAMIEHFSQPRRILPIMPRFVHDPKGRRSVLPGEGAYAEVGKLDPQGAGTASDELVAGRVTRLSPTLRRIVAPNAGLMTGPGTNSYLIGEREIAVVDPGPADPAHIAALLKEAGGPIKWIFVTHTHSDHSPGAALLKAETGAALLGMTAPASDRQDTSFVPDRPVAHGERFLLDGVTLRAIHTPGHASNHVCYLLEEERLLFTGDHIMQGSTVIINPPDGDMAAYFASLHILLDEKLDYLAPGHGFLLDQPRRVVEYLLAHRLGREDKVLRMLAAAGRADLEALLPQVYDDVSPQLHPAAQRSLLAHLIKLAAERRVIENNGQWSMYQNG